MMDSFDGAPEEGEALCIDFDDSTGVEGRVVWRKDGCVGVRFEERLHPVIVQFLGYKQPAAPFDRREPRDRSGRPLGSEGREAA